MEKEYIMEEVNSEVTRIYGTEYPATPLSECCPITITWDEKRAEYHAASWVDHELHAAGKTAVEAVSNLSIKTTIIRGGQKMLEDIQEEWYLNPNAVSENSDHDFLTSDDLA